MSSLLNVITHVLQSKRLCSTVYLIRYSVCIVIDCQVIIIEIFYSSSLDTWLIWWALCDFFPRHQLLDRSSCLHVFITSSIISLSFLILDLWYTISRLCELNCLDYYRVISRQKYAVKKQTWHVIGLLRFTLVCILEMFFVIRIFLKCFDC